ncbi:hypothetical protein, partial [Dorea sp. 210702-DFI.3.17]|uniref:hypothetical protein n=1 Tax=Dorea sp. 210702-DFI.3.17 TaxID=2883208 RepID=UPI001D078E84
GKGLNLCLKIRFSDRLRGVFLTKIFLYEYRFYVILMSRGWRVLPSAKVSILISFIFGDPEVSDRIPK